MFAQTSSASLCCAQTRSWPSCTTMSPFWRTTTSLWASSFCTRKTVTSSRTSPSASARAFASSSSTWCGLPHLTPHQINSKQRHKMYLNFSFSFFWLRSCSPFLWTHNAENSHYVSCLRFVLFAVDGFEQLSHWVVTIFFMISCFTFFFCQFNLLKFVQE